MGQYLMLSKENSNEGYVKIISNAKVKLLSSSNFK